MRLTKKMRILISVSAVLMVGIIVLAIAIANVPDGGQTTVSMSAVTEESASTNDVAAISTTATSEEVVASDEGMAESQETLAGESTQELTEETASVAQNTASPTTVTSSETGTPVANHGELSVSGTKLVDESGNPYQLKGVSTHGINWFPEYVNADSFRTLRDEWGANCVRLAMYTADYNGYCAGGDQAGLKQLVNDGVSYATDLGMYVIIDWHILNDNNPNTNKASAIAFFDEMSSKYANYDNVIYEICNEPNGGTTWSEIKSYAMEVIPVIKANNPNAIIIVGTPTWSQDTDIAAGDPITGYTNIMYTIHFYADTHKDNIRQKMLTAINSGLAIFCTEFGTCSASGNGANNFDEANTWISLMNDNGVSYCIWNLSNKNESSSLIQSGCSLTYGWSESDLSEEGKWYVGILNHGVTPGSTSTGGAAPSTTPSAGAGTTTTTNTTAVTASKDNTQATIVNSGSWDSGSGKCYQYTITIKNTGSSTISNWNLSVSFGSSFSLDQSWNGVYAVSGNNITITPVDFNTSIAAGQSVEIGFIVQCSGSAGSPTVTVN